MGKAPCEQRACQRPPLVVRASVRSARSSSSLRREVVGVSEQPLAAAQACSKSNMVYVEYCDAPSKDIGTLCRLRPGCLSYWLAHQEDGDEECKADAKALGCEVHY